MTERRTEAKGRSRSSLMRTVVVVAAMGAALLGSAAWITRAYADRVSPGVRLGSVSYGGQPVDQAKQDIIKRIEALEGEGILLQHGDQELLLEFTVADESGLGLSADVMTIDRDRTVGAVLGVGRTGSPIAATMTLLRSAAFGYRVDPVMEIDQAILDQAIAQAVRERETPTVEPGFSIGKNGAVIVTPASAGRVFDHQAIAAIVRSRLRDVARDPIAIALTDVNPTTTEAQAETFINAVRKIAAAGSLALRANGKEAKATAAEVVSWLTAKPKQGQPLELGIDDGRLQAYLDDAAPGLTIPVREPKFSIEAGRVTEFQVSNPGSQVDLERAGAAVAAAVFAGQSSVDLPVIRLEPQASAETIVDLGITELVAVGTTNFAGSPVNRRHNIQIGADLLNGLLIKPDEEFSLITAIGPVDKTKGYRQELVIKGNRTIPEFGGGLCQVGTTMFRLTLNAGLPILERQNHSYRVRYYEPPVGMDATIYEPKPDFRFRNDYAFALLLQTRLEGDNLIFEFWGTKDGRVASTTQPKVTNVVAPPPKLTIETTDLKPGEVNCTEKPHPGSDAEFTYTVTRADGQEAKTVFKSKYRPWREVCLVGVKELKPKTDDADQPPAEASNANTNAAVD